MDWTRNEREMGEAGRPGMYWNWLEWSEIDSFWYGLSLGGLEYAGMVWNGLEWTKVKLSKFRFVEIRWNGLELAGLE